MNVIVESKGNILRSQYGNRHVLRCFNRYRFEGGEQIAVELIDSMLSEVLSLDQINFESLQWVGKGAPSAISQAMKMFYNTKSVQQFREAAVEGHSDFALFHNILPVGSIGLYHEAQKLGIPVIQYIHNFRPFAVGGSLWINGKVDERPLAGNFGPEIAAGVWQNSTIKTAILAAVLVFLKKSGWLDSIKCWVAISEFIRSKFIQAGVAPERIVTLKHPWGFLAQVDDACDEGYYLVLSRLIPEKGIRELLAAWKMMAMSFGKECPKLIVAGGGILEDEVREVVQKFDCISYVGVVSGSQKTKLIASCRAMIVPSVWYEPLGLVVYEAYEFFKPVIASSRGGLAEIVFDNETGFSYNGDSPIEEISIAVEKMEKISPSERLEMGERGRRWLEENGSREVWEEGFSKVLKTALT